MEDLGGFVVRGMSNFFCPICHQEVDKKKTGRCKNIVFRAHNSLSTNYALLQLPMDNA